MLLRVLRRVVASLLVLVAATALTFVLIDGAGGDPLDSLRVRQPPVPEQTIAAMQDRLYLDRPVAERYWLWLTGLGNDNGDIGVLQGKWGPSVRDQDIGHEIAQRSLVSIRLLTAAIVVMLLLGVATGVFAAVRRYTLLDGASTMLGYLALALPTFWVAAFVKDGAVWLNERMGHRVFYTIGESSPGGSGPADVIGHLALPSLVIVLSGYAAISRFQRTATIEVLESDFVRMARAKGLRSRVVLRRHALRTSLIPTTTLAALAVSGAITSTVIVEEVFRWRGLGSYLIDSVERHDTYAVMGFVLLSGTVVVVTNLVADLVIGVLDPGPAVRERFLRNRLATAGAIVLLLLTLIAFLGPLVWTFDHRFHPEIVSDAPPSWGHPFGTSRTGHDLLGQAMRGTQQSLRVALLAGALAALIGAVWGAVAGIRGGWLDAVLMRVVDVVLTIPLLAIVLVIAGGTEGTTWFDVGAVIGLLGWAPIARVVRGLTVSVCAYEYVHTARALGATDRHILREHVLPNIAGAAAVGGTVTASAAVVVESALSFVGFGIAPPDTSLGRLVGTSQDAVFTRPWLFLIPGVLLAIVCVAINLLGDGLADALDVRK